MPPKLGERLMIVPFCLLLVLWLWLFWATSDMRLGPNGVTFDNGFATYLSSARVLESHGDPYNARLVCKTETRMLRAQGVPVHQPLWNCRVGNPPLFLWLLRPLVRLPFQMIGFAWVVLLELAALTGILATLHAFGWRRQFLPSIVFLLMPPVVYAAYYGEPDAIVFAGIGLALALLSRHPTLAGSLLVVAWLKPPLGLPVVMLLGLFSTSKRWQFVAGFAVCSAFLLVLIIATTGWGSMEAWAHSLIAFSGDTAVRGHQASLVGIYMRWASVRERALLESVTVLAAAALTWWYWTRHTPGEPFIASAWLWGVWFLAIPYGQYYDEISLALPVLALLGCDGSNLMSVSSITTLYGVLFSCLLVYWTVWQIDPQSLPLVALTLILAFAAWQFHRKQMPRSDGGGQPDTQRNGSTGCAFPDVAGG